MEPVDLYTAAHERVVELVSGLDDGAAATPVPGTPGWTVQNLVAHLTGLPADVNAGRLEGAGTPTWTAGHVDQRRDRTIAELLAEWEGELPAFTEALAAKPVMPYVFDVIVHEHDLRGALGASGPSDEDALDFAVQPVVGRFGARLQEAGIPAVRIVSGDTEWTVGAGDPGATVDVPRFELFRACFGRRSAAQVRTWAWRGDPDPYLAHLSVFGPLPAQDVIEA